MNALTDNLPESIQHRVDARGQKCPLPVLKTRKVIVRAAKGARIEVLCTDPVSVIDVPHLAQEMGCAVAATERTGGAYRFVLVVGDREL